MKKPLNVVIRAVGVVIRRRLLDRCPECGAALDETAALGGRDPGRYPRPPAGTAGYLCGCGHVEYVRTEEVQ